MGIFNKLTEGIFRLRIIPKENPSDKTSFVPEDQGTAAKLQDAVDAGKRIDLSDLSNLTTLKGDRNSKYAAFEEMVSDGRIAAAIEIYANDTVQYNQQGKVIWAESDDSDVANYVNNLLDDLNIPANLWSYAYCMWLYGDVYLETFINTSENGSRPTLLLEPVEHNNSIRTQKHIEGGKLERYIQKVPNPAEVYDLQYKGKTGGYIRSKDDINTTNVSNSTSNQSYLYSGSAENISILSPTKFVHICLAPNISRFPETFRLIKDETKKNKVNEDGYIDGSDEESSGGDLSFTVKTGQSVLENVYGAYQTLKLKEESVLLERVTKSSITRIIQVELGDLPESQKRQKLQAIKNQIEQQLLLNKEAGSLQSRAGAQPIENIIYTSTKNGKGAISTVNIGGDVDIGDLGDVEDSENKLYGSLMIPKALLGADMEGCLAGDTKLLLLNGQIRTIKYIAEHADEYIGKGIMSCNEDGTLVPTKIVNAKLTRKNAILVRVHLDNDTYIDATPDHLFMMRDGSFKEAQDLQYLDSLMPYYDNVKNGRRYVLDNNSGVIKPQYRLVAETKYGKLNKRNYQVHHIDSLKINDDFDNIEYISTSEHCKKHNRMLRCFKCNKIFKKKLTDEEYNQYLNKQKLVICEKECNYSTPCFTKISNSLDLWFKSNEDTETYIINKHSSEFRRSDKYSNLETLLQILNMYNEYEPEVKNHKVISVEWLDNTQDTYDIEVENNSHTFVLANGIFVHNSRAFKWRIFNRNEYNLCKKNKKRTTCYNSCNYRSC